MKYKIENRSVIAIPPGKTIKEILHDRHLTQKEFVQRMDLPEKYVSKLVDGEVKLTPDIAARLELVLGIPATFWNNLEAIYHEDILLAKNICLRKEDDEDGEL